MKNAIIFFLTIFIILSAGLVFADTGSVDSTPQQQKAVCEDVKKDKVAIGVAVGVLIGSGGVGALVPVVGNILSAPFVLLGF